MTGLYIHIPFCRRRCVYCHFPAGIPWSAQKESEYLEAIYSEAALYNKHYGRIPIHTLYYGGGTPSLLSPQGIASLMHMVENFFIFEPKEITLEVNPEDVSSQAVKMWKQIGINRISLGLQSVQDDILQLLSRQKTNPTEVYNKIKEAGFHRISTDFIVGIPGLDEERLISWIKENLPDHLSLYMLSVEKGSILAGLALRGSFEIPDDELQVNQYLSIASHLSSDYEWYEISNFVRNTSSRAIHNTLYWTYEPYIGLGIGASGFLTWEKRRYKNTIHLQTYYQQLKEKIFPRSEEEILDEETIKRERIMLSLRLKEGVDLSWIQSWAGEKKVKKLREEMEQLNYAALLSNNRLALTPEGWMVANALIRKIWDILR